MPGTNDALFSDVVWQLALEKFAAVTHLTVMVYDIDKHVVSGPIHPTPLFTLFQKAGYEPGIFAACAHRCLEQTLDRPAIIMAPSYGLAVVGTSLALEGRVVGAAVAGYTFVDFCQRPAVEKLARDAAVPFQAVWDLARTTQPVPQRRLLLDGELLQVLGDALLRENYRTRQYEVTAAQLTESAAAKDDFLAVLSHELRTPLTPILLWTRMLSRSSDPALIERALEVIERNAKLETRLVDDLLELTRAARGKMSLDLQVRDLGDEVQIALDGVIETARDQRIELRLAAPEQSLPVNVDPDRLQQVLRNVLSNAVKFTPPGGRVEVTVVEDTTTGVIRVRDTGEGIERQFLPHVFEMFRQQEEGARRKHSGLGIGLALVQRLLELHGGSVTVESEGAGRGTEVVMRLPLVSAAPLAERLSLPVLARRSAAIEGLRIVLVEDTADVREAIQVMLEFLGAQVTIAGDGVEALEMTKSQNPDVVLCDLRMPRMDGFEFIRQLHAATTGPQPPVIAMTGVSSAVGSRRIRVAGFKGHLNKPFGERELLDGIASALRSTKKKHRKESA